MAMGPAEPETKNDCDDEGHQQITRPDWTMRATRILLERGQSDFYKRESQKICFEILHLEINTIFPEWHRVFWKKEYF